ncbi:EAL domain-containing protein [Chitiniphilus purpureus]|uniref:EAL domain-containing protein n=1 Tax=Chitiniphilus purpureus TaxID=2981137 RepID=A0ABY6DL95_9NEIS|nr:bifunctional diguanylate cyclase/phosphodiesterase [Chitiniphilus sp. CD1]UXY15140.1 EAL domain-containing protein [Chitiniphilus sp. CD1]
MRTLTTPGSLRTRLIVASILVQCTILAFLLFNTSRIWSEATAETTAVRVQELSRLLNAAFSGPLFNNDFSRAADLIDTIRAPEGIDYLVLLDAQRNVVAARGWDITHPLPPTSPLDGHDPIPALIHASSTIEYGGEVLGELRFGITTGIMREAINRLTFQNAMTMIAGIVASSALMALLGLWLTHRLYKLLAAVETGAAGDYADLPVPRGDDEVAQLARRFNDMSHSIRERMVALRHNEEKFHAIADYTYSTELWLDPEGKLVWVNASVTRLAGYSVNECLRLGDFPLSLASPDERMRLMEALDRALIERSSVQDFEFRAVRRDGSLFWAAASWQPLYDSRGDYLGLRASIRDNSELKDDRLALRKAVIELRQIQALGQGYLQRAEAERARLTALLSAMRFGVLFVDQDNRVVFHNPAFCALWGIPMQVSIVDKPIGQVLQQAENRPAIGDILAHYLQEAAQIDDRVDYGELVMNDGRVLTQQCYRVGGGQGNRGRMWIYEDVTQERQLAERMISLAERDALTGLYNRHRFQQELERMVSEADRRQTSMALLFFDLDEFKYVNDTFGHGIGDELLNAIAREIGAQVRRHEVLSRLGGDEFAILVPDCTEFEVGKLAERIVASIAQIQFKIDGHLLRPSSSVGVALFPQHASSPGELVAHADSAMYQAKAAGKATWRLYRPDADPSRTALNRLSWKDRIVEALEQDGFELHFQGVYGAKDRQLAHLEALVRMHDTQNPGNLILPGHFIPHAEKTGKIVDIDRWVIKRTIELLAGRPHIPSIAINVSGRSFDEPELPEFISRLLSLHRVDPRRLLVELTETAAVSDLRDAQRFIDALRATGCTVCLDDFGNGFASFAYLKQLKADILKIDGFFVRDLAHDRDSQVFVRGIVDMAHAMEKTTIAEFVENETIYDMLVEFGVDLVQGYYLDKPHRDHPGLTEI